MVLYCITSTLTSTDHYVHHIGFIVIVVYIAMHWVEGQRIGSDNGMASSLLQHVEWEEWWWGGQGANLTSLSLCTLQYHHSCFHSHWAWHHGLHTTLGGVPVHPLCLHDWHRSGGTANLWWPHSKVPGAYCALLAVVTIYAFFLLQMLTWAHIWKTAKIILFLYNWEDEQAKNKWGWQPVWEKGE